jgi:hypothetical protein
MGLVGKYLLPLYFFAGLAFVGASVVHLVTVPLRALGVPYPSVLDYWHLLAPAACALVWAVLLRRRPALTAVAVVACAAALVLGVRSAESRVARIPVTRFLTDSERGSLGGVRVFERATSGRGHEVFVAPADEPLAREELGRVGVLRAGEP